MAPTFGTSGVGMVDVTCFLDFLFTPPPPPPFLPLVFYLPDYSLICSPPFFAPCFLCTILFFDLFWACFWKWLCGL